MTKCEFYLKCRELKYITTDYCPTAPHDCEIYRALRIESRRQPEITFEEAAEFEKRGRRKRWEDTGFK